MAQIKSDSQGIPVSIVSQRMTMVTKADVKSPAKRVNTTEITTTAGKSKIVSWGSSNQNPTDWNSLIKGNTVLQRSLEMLMQIILGQGLVPVIVTGYDASNRKIYQLIQDTEIISLLNKSWVTKYLITSIANYLKFGNSFVQFRPSLSGDKIAKLYCANSLHCRVEYSEDGFAKNVVHNAMFPDISETALEVFPLLSEVDPEEALILMKEKGLKPFFYQIKNLLSSNNYYADPSWLSAEPWIEISNKIPTAINAGLDNSFNAALLIRIPYSYWEQKYPIDQYQGNLAARTAKIQADITMLEDKFTTPETYRRTLLTHFGYDLDFPDRDKWEIEFIDMKQDTSMIAFSTAADSYISLAAGLHPDILGLMYGNSKAGSMQREILLLLYALSYGVRQQIVDPLEMLIRFNYPGKYDNMELMFENTFLTTLDTGAGTGQVLS